jgi:phospholipid/cholesterol/gamma-HCH transport system substrate-binding protein
LRTQNVGFRRGMAAIAVAVCAVAILVVVLLATSAGGSGGGYEVRAIFDDAGNAISGEDVKIDGVDVGKIASVTPTPGAQAAVVLKIENPGFQDFRADASCTIRPESLIGEKYVDCLPTQPRVEDTPLPPPLKRIPSGHDTVLWTWTCCRT